MNDTKIQLLDFQPEPSDELADILQEVAKMAKNKFGEKVFSEFIYAQAYSYRSGGFKQEYDGIQAFMKKLEEEEKDSWLLEDMPTEDKIH